MSLFTKLSTGLYINSLALQAVVDRWTTMSHEAQQKNNNGNSNPMPGSGWFQVLMELYRVNEHYIQEVVDASRKILTIVLEELLPGDHLRHAPVRTYFRILSAMIFILKVSFISYIFKKLYIYIIKKNKMNE